MRVWDKSKPPLGPFTLNKDASQAQGLVAWYPMGGIGSLWVPDYVGSAHLTLGTTPAPTVGQSGAPGLALTSASSQYSEGVITAASALPLTIAAWLVTTSTGAVGVPICIGTNGANTRLQLQKDQTTRVVGAAVVDAAGAGNTVQYTSGPGSYVDNVEFHAAAVFTSSTSRQAFLNGVGSAVDTLSISISGMNRILLGGRRNSSSVGAFWGGQVGEVGVWNVALGATDVANLADPGSRFELWYPLRNRKWFSAGAPGTVALTGTAGTVATGSLLADSAVPVAGAAGTVGQGTLGPQLSLPLTGVAGTSGVGSLLADSAASLTGVEATGATGTLSVANADVTAALTGVAGTVGQGLMVPGSAVPMTGVAGTAGQGTLSPASDAPVTGVGGSLGQGVLAPSSTAPLTGVAGTGDTGTLVVYGGDVTVALAGVGAATALGALLPVASSGAASGVTRQWLVDYYTKAFERNPARAPLPAVKRPRAQRPVLKPLHAGEYPSTLEQVEELARRADAVISNAARQPKERSQAEVIVTQALRYAVESPLPVMDFEPLLARYAAQAAARQQQDEDDLALFALVL